MIDAILVVVGGFQLAFLVGLLIMLAVAHGRRRAHDDVDDAVVDALRAPSRALVLGEDGGELLATALAGLPGDARARQLRSIAATQLGSEQLASLATLVRPAPWVERILAGGRSPRWWKRMEAARLLGAVMAPHDLPLLARLLEDEHPAVASAATAAIAGHADTALITAIVAGLHRRPPTVRLQQMHALRSHADTATEVMLAALASSGLRRSARQVQVLVQLAEVLGTPRALGAVVPLVNHPHAEVRAAVARALRLCFTADAVSAARTLLGDPDWRVRAASARALASLRAEDAVHELQTALGDGSWWVRFRAALALGSLGDAGEAALAAAADSTDAFARDIAVVVRGLTESARLELNA